MSRPKIDKVLGKQELRKARQYREQRELEELADMLGDPC
jgi:hypothetical protein